MTIPDLHWFYDTEFHDTGSTIDLISIAIVPGPQLDATPFYAINGAADWKAILENAWLRDNVWPHLPRTRIHSGHGTMLETLDTSAGNVMDNPREIGNAIRRYLGRYSDQRARHALWAYFAAYDHVALAQCFGPMIDLPDCIPMWTHDLMQLWETHGYHSALKPPHHQTEHDALADAQWNRQFYDNMMACKVCPQHILPPPS